MTARDVQVLTPTLLRSWPLPAPDGAKSSRGTVLVIGGSCSTPGAVMLAGTAALRAGAGRLQIATAAEVAAGVAVAVPEAMVVGLHETRDGNLRVRSADRLVELVEGSDVVLLGPGLTDVGHAGRLLDLVLAAATGDTRVVLDAYALPALARRDAAAVLGDLGTPAVVTPNLAEGGALLGREPSDDLDGEAVSLAGDLGCVVSMFGHVASPDGRAWRQEAAGVGLGTSGSGDVLAGVVSGMLARGASPEQAACWAIHVHAAAGDLQAVRFGRTAYLAREIVDAVAPALAALEI